MAGAARAFAAAACSAQTYHFNWLLMFTACWCAPSERCTRVAAVALTPTPRLVTCPETMPSALSSTPISRLECRSSAPARCQHPSAHIW